MTDDDLERIRATIGTGEIIRVIYHGGSQPGVARDIVPVAYNNGKLWAVCVESGRRKMFSPEKMELTDEKPDTATTYQSKPKQPPQLTEFAELLLKFKIPRLGPAKAQALADRFYDLEDLASADREFLMTVDGIGETLADDIRDFFAEAAANAIRRQYGIK